MDPPKNYFRTPQYLMDSVYNLLKVNANIIDFLNCLFFLLLKNDQTAEPIGANFCGTQYDNSGLRSGFWSNR